MMKKQTTYGLLGIGAVFLMLDGLTALEINSSIAYAILLLVTITSLIILIGYYFLKLDFRKTFKFSVIFAGIACLAHGLIYYWGGDWKTQTVIYQNLHLSNRTIEFQMQDVGALGYDRRTVDRIKVLPYIDWIKEIDLKNIDTANWKKVDIDVNEIEFKGG